MVASRQGYVACGAGMGYMMVVAVWVRFGGALEVMALIGFLFFSYWGLCFALLPSFPPSFFLSFFVAYPPYSTTPPTCFRRLRFPYALSFILQNLARFLVIWVSTLLASANVLVDDGVPQCVVFRLSLEIDWYPFMFPLVYFICLSSTINPIPNAILIFFDLKCPKWRLVLSTCSPEMDNRIQRSLFAWCVEYIFSNSPGVDSSSDSHRYSRKRLVSIVSEFQNV
jgi:hypothetical protein